MDQTFRHGLPRMAAQQANRHLTLNAAMDLMDLMLHPSLVSRALAVPPSGAEPGSLYLVGEDPEGDWAGHAGEVAMALDAGQWLFAAPRAGWVAWVADEARLLAHDGTDWRAPPLPDVLSGIEALAIGAVAPDAERPLSAAGAATLLTHAGSDHRLLINRAAGSDTASMVFQTGWSGRAEMGLAGPGGFAIRVSPDGSTWRDALRVDEQTGALVCPSGISAQRGFTNLVMNGGFVVNQRGFAGGALAAGAYGPDRWKAGPSGATLSVTGSTVSLTGTLRQVIEQPDLAGVEVTVSLEAPSAAITVTVGNGGASAASGVIEAGPGRRAVSLTVPGAVTGHLSLDLTAATTATFSRVQLEVGPVATPFERRPAGVELELCKRYYEQIGPGPSTHNPVCVAGALTSTLVSGIVPFAEKRATPTITISGAYDIVGVAAAAGISSLTAFTVTRKAFEMRAVLSAPVSLPACGVFRTAGDTQARITISAEL